MADTPHERVLITGATGFVGTWLIDEIASQRPDTVLYGTSHSGGTGDDSRVTLIPCDITDPAAVRAAVASARPTRIVHLAGIASAAGGDPRKLKAVNADASVSLLQAVAERREPCRVLLASSGYVYGPTEPGRPATEDHALGALGAYAESKVAMEEEVRAWTEGEGKSSGVSVVLARAFNHTGPRQTDTFVVPAFAKQIARIEAGKEEPVVKVGNLEALRDFLHVGDVVRAYHLLLGFGTENAETISVVNVASGVGRSIRSLLDELIELSRVRVSVEPDPTRMRPADLPECIGDPSKLRSLTNWEPTVSIRHMLEETLEWWRKQSL